jgi:engulfment/cell motility protein 1
MSLHTIEDLTSCILDFQANIVRITNRKKTTLVDPEIEDAHAAALMVIWECSKLEEEIDADGQPLRWRKLGFDTEDIIQEFSEVGVLGLECLVSNQSNMTVDIPITLFLCFIEKVCGKRSRVFQGQQSYSF